MKKLYTLILLASIVNNCFAVNHLKGEVNKCFELTSIVFRLADSPEYVNNQAKIYTSQIDSFFGKYKNHKVISLAKELRKEYGISYDAVSTAAAYIEIKNGKVKIREGVDITKIDEIDSRWSQTTFKIFVHQLNEFYLKSKFEHFYLQHTELYHSAVENANKLLENINYEWFGSFVGEQYEVPLVIISLCNGSNNYAFSLLDKKKITHGIVLGCNVDDNGVPSFQRKFISIVVHEISHGYSNNLISKYWNQLEKPSEIIFYQIKDSMNELAYISAKSMLTEWLTNLFSVIYFQDNQCLEIPVNYLIRDFQNKGFIWMERSTIFMRHYIMNRHQFINFENFMPQILDFVNFTVNNFDQVKDEFNKRKPYIVDVFPPKGSLIPSDISTIEIQFSEPMIDAHGLKKIDDNNILAAPILNMPSWKNEYTYVIQINKALLEDNKTYGIKLNCNYFQSKRTYAMNEDYIYIFNTNKQ